ncbi:cell wall protein [Agromyces badenianii]|uniref:cell wall protein n=1 Tax=Agromyces badenianii TaxID=2080742 RepID=UPI001FCC3E66|nr:cell wall protein [Agromyces badenianii]
MLRKVAAIALVAAFLTVPTAAYAEQYPPTTPPADPTLAGSAVTGICDGDVPYIGYTVDLIDPDNVSTGHTATLVLSDGSNSTSIPLGTIVNGALSGRVLWPGAAVNSDGSPAGWPGWDLVDGVWVETDGNFAWTRSITSATITVNPSISVPLSYPPSSPNCATSPRGSGAVSAADTETLSATGVSEATFAVAFGALGLVVIGGAVLLLTRRLAKR